MASFNDEYVFSALKTESMSEAVALRLQDERTIRLLHAGMGMVTEAAEFLDALKKHIFYGKAIDYTNLAEEIGDQLWYVAIGTDAIEVRLDDVMDTNIAKLKARYPQNFDAKAAVNRDLEAERKILESVKISVDTMERRG
jgi:NTP pyrophosphatase (non-canonical NTP hydrolase)